MGSAEETRFSDRTAWALNVQAPLHRFLRTETGSAAVLVAAALVALVWANAAPSSYQGVWSTRLSVQIGGWGVSQDLVTWVNSGLMTFFFFVVGLEVRREVDLGELREGRRVALPLLADAGGIVASVGIFLALNAGRPSAHGWGVAMSTDTAFALGMLALLGPRLPERLRSFVLTIAVADDIVALVVIASVYSNPRTPSALVIAVGLFAAVLAVAALQVRLGLVYAALGAAAWVALLEAGVDPVVIGLAMGLMAYAATPARADLERATSLFRGFREQPTSALARSARIGLDSAVSPNARLQQTYHPWTSYVIVPLFALANAGITIDGSLLSRAYRSPITLGIVLGYMLGKPAGILGASWLVTRLSRGRLQPPVGWAAVAGSGTVAGIGFTVTLLIATLAFQGPQLQEAKIGVLTAALGAAALSFVVFRATALLPAHLRTRALLGTSDVIVDLAEPVDSRRDHFRGPDEAPVTLVEYGDFECPYCGQAEPVVRELLRDSGDVRYVWRHLPLTDVHPRAQLAAEASEAAAAQGAFWEMHDLLLAHQDALRPDELAGYAEQLGLDVERFEKDLRKPAGARRVSADVDSADLSGVSGTPTFFVNGRRLHGAYDIESLSRAVATARARAAVASRQGSLHPTVGNRHL
ncbi:MAG TPA: Na+/H+ antiporter NhaA [Candidatus Dormibacteraeota bacterium]